MLQVRNRRKNIEKIGETSLVNALIPTYSQLRKNIKIGLLLFAFIVGVIGLANLQAGTSSAKIERKGIDVMIALDVSKSMMAKDINPNRLEKAKQFIYRLLEKISNDRVGLVIFAGRAYVSVPLTTDFSALKMNLSTASPSMVPTQGTVLGEAIKQCRESFNTKETKYKSIVLISDGEDHDDQAAEEVKKAVSEGIMINTIGIGSKEGSPIWDDDLNENKKDENGQEIISKLNEDELQKIASNGQGIYQYLNNSESSSTTIAKQISSSEQRSFGDSMFTDYKSYFQYFIALSLIALLIDLFISERKRFAL